MGVLHFSPGIRPNLRFRTRKSIDKSINPSGNSEETGGIDADESSSASRWKMETEGEKGGDWGGGTILKWPKMICSKGTLVPDWV